MSFMSFGQVGLFVAIIGLVRDYSKETGELWRLANLND